MNLQSVGVQIHIATKFIESPSKITAEHKVMTKRATESLVSKLDSTRGVDLLTAPRVVTRPGQQAKVEVIQELKLKATAYNKTVPVGVTLDVLPKQSTREGEFEEFD